MHIFSKRHAFRFQEGKGRFLVSGTLFLLLLLFNPYSAQAQRVAVRTNLVQWGAASPNLGLEFALGNLAWNVLPGQVPYASEIRGTSSTCIFSPNLNTGSGH